MWPPATDAKSSPPRPEISRRGDRTSPYSVTATYRRIEAVHPTEFSLAMHKSLWLTTIWIICVRAGNAVPGSSGSMALTGDGGCADRRPLRTQSQSNFTARAPSWKDLGVSMFRAAAPGLPELTGGTRLISDRTRRIASMLELQPLRVTAKSVCKSLQQVAYGAK